MRLRICAPGILIFVYFLVATAGAQAAPDYAPGDHRLTLKVGGYERTAMLHVPASYRRDAPPALVIGLHGAGGDGADFLTANGWSRLSDHEGFLVVAPDGLPARPSLPANFFLNPRLWNCGQLPSSSERSRIDDVAFLGALLELLAQKTPFDERRVFLTGHSMGGCMTFRLARRMSDRIAAIATVAGIPSDDSPALARALPTLFIHGEKDPLLRAAGGPQRTPWGSRSTQPVPWYMKHWASALGCDGEPSVKRDDDRLRVAEFHSCRDQASFRWITIKGQGHGWPGGKSHPLLRRWLGPETDNLDATTVIWEFFAAAAPLPIAPAKPGE